MTLILFGLMLWGAAAFTAWVLCARAAERDERDGPR